MLVTIACILAAASLVVSWSLTFALLRLRSRSQQLQQALITVQNQLDSQRIHAVGNDLDPYSTLSGLRIALAIEQDHTLPTLTLMLKDALGACDAEVSLLDTRQALLLSEAWGHAEMPDPPDLLIWGSVTCNGYSEVYYKAMLNYLTPYGLLNPTSEQPSHGNPQSSLVVTIVSKLKRELVVAQRRQERGRALSELRADSMLRQIEK